MLSDLGGVSLVLARVVRVFGARAVDRRELMRSMYGFGVASLPIVALTAAFVGMSMVLQGAMYVRQYGVYDLVGWYAGFTTFREVGPVLIGLMFSGRVGAANTSELATMRLTEQLDALRILALDPYEILIAPRVLAMSVAMPLLVCIGDLVALLGGAVCAGTLLSVSGEQFLLSITTRLAPTDVLVGLVKATVFGFVIAIVSTHFGLSSRGGGAGVGRAVNAQVVGCAIAIFVSDYFITLGVR